MLHLKPPTLGACALIPGLSSRSCGFTQTTSGGAWVGDRTQPGFHIYKPHSLPLPDLRRAVLLHSLCALACHWYTDTGECCQVHL